MVVCVCWLQQAASGIYVDLKTPSKWIPAFISDWDLKRFVDKFHKRVLLEKAYNTSKETCRPQHSVDLTLAQQKAYYTTTFSVARSTNSFRLLWMWTAAGNSYTPSQCVATWVPTQVWDTFQVCSLWTSVGAPSITFPQFHTMIISV